MGLHGCPVIWAAIIQGHRAPVGEVGLALQLPFLRVSESMGNHDSKIVDADGVD
jgi:hypothetical protein